MNTIDHGRLVFVAWVLAVGYVPCSAALPLEDCEVSAGTINAHVSTICFYGDTVNIGGVWNQPTVPPGFIGNFLLTTGPDQVIVQGAFTPAFNVGDTGTYTIHPFVYESGSPALVGLVFGVSTLAELHAQLVQGGGVVCASLDMTGDAVLVQHCLVDCDANAGTASALEGSFCFDGIASIEAIGHGDHVAPPGFGIVYLLASGTPRRIEGVSSTAQFDVFAPGDYSIHTLVHDPSTFDPGSIVLGATTIAQLHASFANGGGTICAAVHVNGAHIEVLDCRPANDECVNAEAVVVGGPGGCDEVSVSGDNRYATKDLDLEASCGPLSASLADVWYVFNSGPNTEVSISLGPISMANWGLTVSEGCTDGTEITCVTNPAAPVDVATQTNTLYRVRVFTNTDLGLGGQFVLCLTGATASVPCDAGEISGEEGERYYDVCKDGLPDAIYLGTTTVSTASYRFVLTDANGTIVGMVPDGMFDADTLALGSYRVYGISFLGELENAEVGGQLNDIAVSVGCVEFSSSFVVLNVEVCSGVAQSGGVPLHIFPNPSMGSVQVAMEVQGGERSLEVLTVDGRVAERHHWPSGTTGSITLNPDGDLAKGVYVVRLTGDGREISRRLVIH